MSNNQTGVLDRRIFPTTKSFGPSKNDVLVALEGVFGPPAHPEKLDEYTDYHASVYDLPAAYIGQSVLVRETLNNLITDAVENWQTTVGMPFKYIDGLTVSWDEISFDRSILPRVPNEGASRFLTSIKRSHRDRIVRRGAAMIAESDFYRTQKGVEQFSNEIRSIQQCVQLTCNYDVMFQYLTNAGFPRDYEIRKKIVNNRNIASYMRREISTYAVLCKGDDNGLDIALETARRLMAEYDVTPNMVIMDPATQLYLRMVPTENKQMYLAGETGVQRFNSFNGGQGITDYRGLQVYVQHSFDAGNDANINMLERDTQVGEFYVMQPPKFLGGKVLPDGYMDLTIFDENMDKLETIGFSAALEHACPWLLDPAKITGSDPFKMKGDHPLIADSVALLADATKAVAAAQKIANTNSAGNAAKWFNGFNWQNAAHWRAAVELATLGVWVPVCLVITRPFIEHRMLSMIVTVAGADTGVTAYGQSDFQIARNVNVKMIEGHYTFYSKAVVTKPKNIFVLEDVQCNGYIGGSDTTWFGDRTAMEKGMTYRAYIEDQQANSGLTAGAVFDNVENELKARLDKDEDNDPSAYASMLAFACPYDTNAKFFQHQMFAISGAPLPWEPNMVSDRFFPGGLPFFQAYTQMYGLGYISQSSDPASIVGGAFLRNGPHNNSVCIQGPYRSYHPLKKYVDLTPGKGHFGGDAVSGDARWRRGECINAKQARDQYVDPSRIVIQTN